MTMLLSLGRGTNLHTIKRAGSAYRVGTGRVSMTLHEALFEALELNLDLPLDRATWEFVQNKDTLNFIERVLAGASDGRSHYRGYYKPGHGLDSVLVLNLEITPDGVALNAVALPAEHDPLVAPQDVALDMIDAIAAEPGGVRVLHCLRLHERLRRTMHGVSHEHEQLLEYLASF